MSLDGPHLRASSRSSRARACVYLDSAATSQTPRPVIEAMDRYYNDLPRVIHRGVYPLAAEATDAYEGARDTVAAFTGSTPGETVFTRNATEAINLVAYSWGRANVARRRPLVLTRDGAPLQHRAVAAARQDGRELAYVAGRPTTGLLDLDALDALLAHGPKLVAVAHVSNVLGTINPIAEIVRRAHAAGAIVLVDGAQAVPHMPVDVAALGADFYAWTGHKAYGPTGIGVLHGRRELLEAMPPFLGGGHMIARVGDYESTWAEPPAQVRGGHDADRRGDRARRRRRLARRASGWTPCASTARDVTAYALERLGEVRGLTLHGPADVDAARRRARVRARRRPPARRRRDPRPRGRLRPRRPPLRAAADAPPRRRGHARARRSRSTPRARTSTA